MPKGDPTGCIVCDVANWDGKVFKIAKNQLREYKERADLQYTGVYILVGEDDTEIYIGEAENLYARLMQHVKEDFWNTCVAFVKKENAFNKAHVKYLENHLYNLAKEADRCIVINSCTPTKSSLSEADEAALDDFAQKAVSVMGALGYKIFAPLIDDNFPNLERFTILLPKSYSGLTANGIVTNEGFVVLKGSSSVDSFSDKSSDSLRKKWNELHNNGLITDNIFTKNYLASSPSTAAAMVLGRNANGLTEWKTKDKKTLKNFLKIK